jgi:hypothetical protein
MKKVKETYSLRLEGQQWARGLSCEAVFQAIESAYEKLGDPNEDMLFLIEENYTGSDHEHNFCVNAIMWEALCETPDAMRMYLRMSRDTD